MNWKKLLRVYSDRIPKASRYVVLAAAIGLLLLLLPRSSEKREESVPQEEFDSAAAQREIENILREIEGTGRLRLLLTLSEGTEKELASDWTERTEDGDSRERREETVVLGRGGNTQEVVVLKRTYPAYRGALVVCEGAGSASVRLAVTEALCALTGLSSDKIVVARGKP